MPAPPTTTAAPQSETGDLPVAALAWGLFCRDLGPQGYSYEQAVAYWIAEGRPQRMDADRNGIPCETVFAADEITAYWGQPLPTSGASGAGAGWSPSGYEPRARPGCCDANASAPESPPLPPEVGLFPDDGVFHLELHRARGEHGQLVVTIRRYVPCIDLPDRCNPPFAEDDVTYDETSGVVRSLPLDESLTVVINGIPFDGGSVWEVRRIEGDGAALARLLERLDAAFAHAVASRYDAGVVIWEVENRLADVGDGDPTFPFAGELGDESGGFFHYRGPAGTPLTCSLYSLWPGSAAEQEDWMYGWWPSLEIVDGQPILYLEAGQIAG